MELPKYNRASKKGEDGITVLKRIIENDFKWLFRPNHKEHDFGIDAYIDVITEAGHITGKTIAAQVKTGSSYFNETNNFGWVFRGQMAHLNYYLNHDIPIIIILVDEINQKVYWCNCDPDKTEKAGDNWKITVPFNSELQISSKSELQKYISPIKDYVSQLETFWALNKRLKASERIIFIVDKPYVLTHDYSALLKGLERLQVNSELVLHFKEKIDIGIHGYDFDKRELYEIPEVISFVNLIFEKITGLSYLLAKDKGAQFLKVFQLCNTDYKFIPEGDFFENGIRKRKIEINQNGCKPLLDKLFQDLNEFSDRHNISEEINKEISFNIVEYLIGVRPPTKEN